MRLNSYRPYGRYRRRSFDRPYGRFRNGPDRRRHIPLRETLGEHLRDPGVALVGGRRDQLVHVPAVEMRDQQGDPAQVEPSIRDGGVDHGKPPRRASRPDALAGDVLGHVQHVQAVAVHGFVRRGQEQLAAVELGEMQQFFRGHLAAAGAHGGQFAGQSSIGQVGERADSHRSILDGGGSSRGLLRRRDRSAALFGGRGCALGESIAMSRDSRARSRAMRPSRAPRMQHADSRWSTKSSHGRLANAVKQNSWSGARVIRG